MRRCFAWFPVPTHGRRYVLPVGDWDALCAESSHSEALDTLHSSEQYTVEFAKGLTQNRLPDLLIGTVLVFIISFTMHFTYTGA